MTEAQKKRDIYTWIDKGSDALDSALKRVFERLRAAEHGFDRRLVKAEETALRWSAKLRKGTAETTRTILRPFEERGSRRKRSEATAARAD